MKIFRRISAFVLSAAMVMSMGVTASAKELVTIDGYKYVSDGGENTLYTGWTTVNGLHRYYKEGKRCLGWRKIGNNYYYLTRNGGRARGLYQIGDTVYEFCENGKYIGKASSDTTIYMITQAASDRIEGYANIGTDPDGYDIYADEYGGINISIDGSASVYLTSDKNFAVYSDLLGDYWDLEFVKTDMTYNDVMEIKRYIKESADELNIFNIINISQYPGGVSIEVDFYDNDEDEDKYINNLYEKLIEKGFSGDISISNVHELEPPWFWDDFE